MLKLLYVPLDERPCNADYPVNALAVSKDICCEVLPKRWMGCKKKAGNTEKIWQFIQENIEHVDYGIISTEMLLYGGLLASRLHHFEEVELENYAKKMRQLKEKNPTVSLYLSNLIMRTPKYSSSDEEPEYYEEWGAQIFRHGWLMDKNEREALSPDEKEELTLLKEQVPIAYIQDYEARRLFNNKVNLLNVRLVEEGIVDFLAIPQDDSAPYGYTAMDQKKVYTAIYSKNLKSKIMVYPGADEVGFTLLARAYNDAIKRTPKVFVNYASTLGPTLIPLYEDRMINESLKAHVMAAGMTLTTDIEAADYYLAYNTPGKIMQESWDQFEKRDVTYDSFRHLLTFVAELEAASKRGMSIGICDSAYSNGGDIELIRMLDQRELLSQIAVYKAWNTNCNSLGSALAALSFINEQADAKIIKENLLSNIVEDGFYQAVTRLALTKEYLPTINTNYFDLKDKTELVIGEIKAGLEALVKKDLPQTMGTETLYFKKLSSPWNRMFEINCQVGLRKGE